MPGCVVAGWRANGARVRGEEIRTAISSRKRCCQLPGRSLRDWFNCRPHRSRPRNVHGPHAAAEPRLRKVQLAVEQVTIKDWRVGCNTQCSHSSIGGSSLELDARQTRIVHYRELSGTDRNPPGTPLSRECWGENKYAQLAGIASAGSPPGRADGQRVRDPRIRTGGYAAATGLLNGQRPGQLRTGLGAECTYNSRQTQLRVALLLVIALPGNQTLDPCFLQSDVVSSS